MDDFLVLVYNKQEAWQLQEQIQHFLVQSLKLRLNPKRLVITPALKGINFLGYIVFSKYCLLRPATVKRYTRKARAKLRKGGARFLFSPEFQKSWSSWNGYAKFAKCYYLRKKILANLGNYALKLNDKG
jgi:hypothetical protein